MKLQTGEELLTVRDIAERIAPRLTPDSIAKALRQVRHWTQNDLLQTASEKSTGRGVPRLYPDEPTCEVAAILQELSSYGVSVDVLRPVAEALYEEGYGDMYIFTATTDMTAFLQVSWNADPETGQLKTATVHMFDDMDIGSAKGKHVVDDEPTSSVLINLNKVLQPVFDRRWGSGDPVVEEEK